MSTAGVAEEFDGDPRSRSVRGLVVAECMDLRMADGVQRKRRERLQRAETDLLRCVEAEAESMLPDDERALLAMEREFDPAGAVGRVAAPEVLLGVLPSYLIEPEWEGEEAEDRRGRMRLATDLAGTVVRLPCSTGADLACDLHELRARLTGSAAECCPARFGVMAASCRPLESTGWCEAPRLGQIAPFLVPVRLRAPSLDGSVLTRSRPRGSP